MRVASRRYQPGATLAGRFRQGAGQWSARFILLYQGKTQYLSAEGERQGVVAAAIIDQVADYFAAIYAQAAGAVTTGGPLLSLRIDNIGDFADYTGVLNYLQGITWVDALLVTGVSPQSMQVGVHLNSDRQRFLKALQLDGRLQQISGPSGATLPARTATLGGNGVATTSGDQPLEFVWQ